MRQFFLRALRRCSGGGGSGSDGARPHWAQPQAQALEGAEESEAERKAVDGLLQRAPLRVGRLRELEAAVSFRSA